MIKLLYILLVSVPCYCVPWGYNPNYREPYVSKYGRKFGPPKVLNVRVGQNHVRGPGTKIDMDRGYNSKLRSALDRVNRHTDYYAEKMENGIPYAKEGYRGSARLYAIDVSFDSANWLTVMTNGGTGDVDIYVRKDDYPTKRNYDQRSAHPGNQEQVTIDLPKSGRYYIVLYGYEDYRNVGFEAEYR